MSALPCLNPTDATPSRWREVRFDVVKRSDLWNLPDEQPEYKGVLGRQAFRWVRHVMGKGGFLL